MGKDKGLDYLLDLDGEIWFQEAGCWIKIEARQLEKPVKECPHGIKYSLTLHDQYGKRLLGFDNAHPIKSRKRGRYKGRKIINDHIHRKSEDEVAPYTFESADQLISDFLKEVDKILVEIKR